MICYRFTHNTHTYTSVSYMYTVILVHIHTQTHLHTKAFIHIFVIAPEWPIVYVWKIVAPHLDSGCVTAQRLFPSRQGNPLTQLLCQFGHQSASKVILENKKVIVFVGIFITTYLDDCERCLCIHMHLFMYAWEREQREVIESIIVKNRPSNIFLVN